MTRLDITTLTVADLPALAALEQQSRFEPWPPETLRSALTHPAAVALGARDRAGVLAGFAIGWVVAGELHLHDLCVAPPCRGRGAGRALLTAFLAAGPGPASLEVRASNVPAIALYRAGGFVVAGCRPDYYDLPREDALVMVRPC